MAVQQFGGESLWPGTALWGEWESWRAVSGQAQQGRLGEWRKTTNSLCVYSKLLQSCLTLWDPMDCILPGFSVHGILQTRILEWVVSSFSRGSSQPRKQTYISYVYCTGRWILYQLWYLGSPKASPSSSWNCSSYVDKVTGREKSFSTFNTTPLNI